MSNVNFQAIGEYLTKHKLWSKSLSKFNKDEMARLCEVILESTDPTEGFIPPYINEDEILVIPFQAPIKYRWWQGGQSALTTLEELGASNEIKAKYTPYGYREGLRKQND